MHTPTQKSYFSFHAYPPHDKCVAIGFGCNAREGGGVKRGVSCEGFLRGFIPHKVISG